MAMPFSPCDPSGSTCPDVSVGLLEHIFGPVVRSLWQGTDPNAVAATANVLASLFGLFNSGVLAVGSIIMAYVASVGMINTANDGEAMGKNWSSVWTTMRVMLGGAVLLPSTSGYSFIQMFTLMLALWSVGFANGIYKLGIEMGVIKPEGIVASSYQPGTYFGMREFAKQYFAVAYCARAANTVYADPSGGPNPMVKADATAEGKPDRWDKRMVAGPRVDYTFYVRDRNAVTNLGSGSPICGTVTLTAYSAAGAYADSSGVQATVDALRSGLMSAKLAAASGLMQDLDTWVASMPSDINQPGWSQVESKRFNEIVKFREDQVTSSIAAQVAGSEGSVNGGMNTVLSALTRDGWAMAGGWYQRVGQLRTKLAAVIGESVGNATPPSLAGLPGDARASLLRGSVTTVVDAVIKKAEEAGGGYESAANIKPEDLASMIPKDGTGDINVGALAGDMGVKLSLFVNNVMQGATDAAIGSGSNVDAVSRMKLTGDLLASYQAMLLAAKFTINSTLTVTRAVVAGVGGVEVLGTRIDGSGALTAFWDFVQADVMPALVKMAEYVGVLGFYFSVALPTLPYALFIIAVVGWLLGVVQTVIAVPLWAIMHMRPSQSFIGSESQGYLLLMALFVRPALGVIGLFASMLIADPVVDYIAKAFFAMRGDVVTSNGWIGAITQFFTFFWWFAAFGAVLFPVLYMVFGLPQILPDRVLAWLNVGVHDLGATNAGGKMQGQLEQGGARAGKESVQGLIGGQRTGGGPDDDGDGGGGGDGRPGRQGGDRDQEVMSLNEQGVAPPVDGETAAPSPALAGGRASQEGDAGGAGQGAAPQDVGASHSVPWGGHDGAGGRRSKAYLGSDEGGQDGIVDVEAREVRDSEGPGSGRGRPTGELHDELATPVVDVDAGSDKAAADSQASADEPTRNPRGPESRDIGPIEPS